MKIYKPVDKLGNEIHLAMKATNIQMTDGRNLEEVIESKLNIDVKTQFDISKKNTVITKENGVTTIIETRDDCTITTTISNGTDPGSKIIVAVINCTNGDRYRKTTTISKNSTGGTVIDEEYVKEA